MDTIHFLFIFVGIDVAVNNIRVLGVAMEMQPWVSFPMLKEFVSICNVTSCLKVYIIYRIKLTRPHAQYCQQIVAPAVEQ
jgi:hypothetical protein